MKRLAVVSLVTLLLSVVFYRQLAQAIMLLSYITAVLLVLAAVGGGLLAGWFVIEKMRLLRASRIEAEKQAQVMVITNHGQTWIRDTNHKAIWKAGHLEQRVYSNGRYTVPSPTETEAWQWLNAPKSAPASPKQMLLPPVAPQADLLPALDSVQRCLIVGATDAGKTTLLQHIITRRLQSSKVVVIDPHAWPDKWPGCRVVGTGRDYDEIDRALAALVQIMTKRYDEIGRGQVVEGQHPRLTILIDEWRAIVFNLGKPAGEAIKSLLTESRKAAFSVFIATHSDRAKPLGLEGEYDLKDGFAVVRLTIANGQRQATLDTGSGETPATLPGPLLAGRPQLLTGDYINLDSEPTPTEADILRLHQQGKSISAIAQELFGHKGGHQNDQVKSVLGRFGASVGV